MIVLDYRMDWIVRSSYRLDWLSISIAKIWIDWIGNPGLEASNLDKKNNLGRENREILPLV